MRTVAFKDVLDGAIGLSGSVPAEAQAQEVTLLLGHVNRRLRKAWEYFAWPELLELQQRWYRDEYDNAAAYAAGAEVYYAATDKYYTATQSTTGNLPTDTDYWAELTEFERYVAWEQTGETALGEVLEVWSRNPRLSRLAARVGYAISARGLELPPSCNTPATSVWVEYRLRPVRMNATVWDSAETYVAGAEVYFLDASVPALHGRCFRSTSSTSAAESPATDPEKWAEIEFPYVLATAVEIGAHLDWLKTDGQAATSEFGEADFKEALDDAVEQVVAQQQQTPGWNVRTRAAG